MDSFVKHFSVSAPPGKDEEEVTTAPQMKFTVSLAWFSSNLLVGPPASVTFPLPLSFLHDPL